ncbi:MAG: hypothetical protein KME13_11140 [Myxacorys californica WJT36-NPBG1]|jgi:hypothetical protein|nr:hypothetical protein [Myxacorys californica WJT36-NPBG1]
MNHRIFGSAISAVLSILISSGAKADEMHSPNPSHSSTPTHAHGKLEIPTGSAVPAVDLKVAPDPMGGWNVQVKAENFRFAPEQVNQTSSVNEGHAHLYVNGKKLTRLYGAWYYLDKLPTGPHSVTVTLNTNRHEELFHNGKRIEATERFIVFPAGAGH